MKTLFCAASFAAIFFVGSAFAQSASPAAPSTVIYLPQLPSADELSRAAAAQGQTIAKIEQTNGQVTVVYQGANGTTNTVAYLPLSQAGSSAPAPVPAVVPAPSSPPPQIVYQAAPPPVVYQAPAPVYYPDYYAPDYYAPYYYPSLSFGFGYYRGWGGDEWGEHEHREGREGWGGGERHEHGGGGGRQGGEHDHRH